MRVFVLCEMGCLLACCLLCGAACLLAATHTRCAACLLAAAAAQTHTCLFRQLVDDWEGDNEALEHKVREL